jgi:hypothetical protein
MSDIGIVERLRNYDTCHDGDIDEAADMIEFLLGSLQSHSIKMNGEHSWRWHSGWPLSSVRASTAEEAVRQAIKLIKSEPGANL